MSKLHLSEDYETANFGHAGFSMFSSETFESTLLDWFPVDGRMCAIKLRVSYELNGHRSSRCNLLIA